MRLHAPNAFGEEVSGSTPLFSTKKLKPSRQEGFFYWSEMMRLHAPNAFGEEVSGSTPLFSTKKIKAFPTRGLFLLE
jgi:hypothetical protein